MNVHDLEPERRPVASRDRAASKIVAHWLAVHGASPNAISLSGMAAGLGAGAALAATALVPGPLVSRLCFASAAVLIQLRLLANMFDGMVAIETGKTSPAGELYNEVPDRISDAAMFIGAGYGVGGQPFLGYLAACLAVFLAYLRAQGKVAGAPQEFCGPMAKPQRAFIITTASFYCAVAPVAWQDTVQIAGWGTMAWVLALVIAGELWTSARRLRRIVRHLRNLPS